MHYSYILRVEDDSQDDAGDDQVGDAELRGDVQVAEAVVLLVVSGDQWAKQSIQRQTY